MSVARPHKQAGGKIFYAMRVIHYHFNSDAVGTAAKDENAGHDGIAPDIIERTTPIFRYIADIVMSEGWIGEHNLHTLRSADWRLWKPFPLGMMPDHEAFIDISACRLGGILSCCNSPRLRAIGFSQITCLSAAWP